VIKQGVRQERERALGARQISLPEGRFCCIMADPEWDRTTWSEAGRSRHADNHYAVSSDEVIGSRDVPSIAAVDCVLGLWCTDPHRGVDVLRAWGFEPKSYFVWVKDVVEEEPTAPGGMLHTGAILRVTGAAGPGYWNRDRDELLLIGTQGHVPCPAPGGQGESVWFARRPLKPGTKRPWHSAKPDCAYEWFERHFPTLPKIELNTRRRRPGWTSWGDEVPEEPAVCPEDALPPHDPDTGEIFVECGSVHHEPAMPSTEPLIETSHDDGLALPNFLRRGHSDCIIGGGQ
jgi:N6-adenosine-specific RNA methylase IME4